MTHVSKLPERSLTDGMVHVPGGAFRMGSDNHYPEEAPSHRVVVTPGEGMTRVALSGGRSLMDRDFVLNLRLEGTERASAVVDRDLDGHVAYASFNPVFPPGEDTGPRSVKVVVDCSGSMGGDSIAQARVALARILGSLRPQDHFNVVLFGSHHRALFPLQVPADGEHLGMAHALLEQLDADMGSTELGAALTVGGEAGPGTSYRLEFDEQRKA